MYYNISVLLALKNTNVFVWTVPPSPPFFTQNEPKFHFLKNNSLEMAVRYR